METFVQMLFRCFISNFNEQVGDARQWQISAEVTVVYHQSKQGFCKDFLAFHAMCHSDLRSFRCS